MRLMSVMHLLLAFIATGVGLFAKNQPPQAASKYQSMRRELKQPVDDWTLDADVVLSEAQLSQLGSPDLSFLALIKV